MSLNTVQEIEKAIGNLTPQELEELRLWLEQYSEPQSIDAQLEADLASGLFDECIQQALDDYDNGRTQPL
jgi:hypothetical protein